MSAPGLRVSDRVLGLRVVPAIGAVAARGLLGRRRTLVLVALAGAPVLAAALVRLGGRLDPVEATAEALDLLVVRGVLPLVALVLGTAALGAELDDGTATHLLTKPVARWAIVVAKVGVVAGVTGGLVATSALLTGLVIGGASPALAVTAGYLAGVVAGAACYGALFVALGVLTSRALAVGLAYVVLWEGVLAGLLEGAEAFSVRQYAQGVAAAVAIALGGSLPSDLDPLGAFAGTLAAASLGIALATVRLTGYEIRGRD